MSRAPSDAFGSPAPGRKIAILTIAAAMGGMERHSIELATTLVRRGHTVRLIELGSPILRGNAQLAAAGIEPEHVQMVNGVKETKRRTWMLWLDQLGADLVILAKGTVTVGSLALDRAAASGGRTYITIEHCAPPSMPSPLHWRLGGRLPGFNAEFVRRPLRYWQRSLAPHLIVCVSDAVREALIHVYGFPASRTVVARNGTDVARFAPSAERRLAARAAWAVPDDAFVIGAVARFNRVKKLDELIAVFERVRASHPEADARLVLVGDGPDNVALRARAASSAAGGVIMFPGASNAPEVVYPGFDVFALSSSAEGLPLALLEAMACGVPAVAYDVGGVAEVLNDARGGWLVAAGDKHALERALAEAVVLPPARRDELTKTVRERVVSEFDVRRSMGRLVALIERAAPTRA